MGDYKNDFLIIGIIFPILAGISVALRFKARYLAKQTLLADDWLALVAMVCPLSQTKLLNKRLTKKDICLGVDSDCTSWQVIPHAISP
jgi:hypothetical protein